MSDRRLENHVQLQDGKIGETIIFIAPGLVVQIVFEDVHILWVVPICSASVISST